MTSDVNFDALAQKTFAQGATTDDYERLFAAAFSLPEWHFISTAVFPAVAPYCAVFPGSFDGLPMVTAFTDTERLGKFIAERNQSVEPVRDPIILSRADASVNFSSGNVILSIPPEKFLDYIEKLTEYGVRGIFFNPNTYSAGFFIGLQQLPPIKTHLEDKNMLARPVQPPPAAAPVAETPPAEVKATTVDGGGVDFDALSVKATASNRMEDLNVLFGAVFALPQWEFIARGNMPNVSPYVASNAAYADNQPMIRAFTDGKRLIRFARENNLTRADGSCDSISIPTTNIVDYLEQFISQGAYGIWFNSDTESDGFFVPLKQLRPIKEHLAKLNLPAAKSAPTKQAFETLIVQIKDGLGFASGFVKESGATHHSFCRVPADWVEGGQLKPAQLEKIYAQFFGANWRSGNSDGSHYVLLDSYTQILPPESIKTTQFAGTVDAGNNQFRFYVTDRDEAIRRITAEEFQKVIDSSFEDVPMADDAYYEIYQSGLVRSDASLAPFLRIIEPLLKDYADAGTRSGDEFNEIFSPGENMQITTTFEELKSNAHGVYLRHRKYSFSLPGTYISTKVESLAGRFLKHIANGDYLSINLTLQNNPLENGAKLTAVFSGHKSVIENLAASINPAFEQSAYKEILDTKTKAPAKFEKLVGEAANSAARPAAKINENSPSEDFGITASPNGEMDLNLNINNVGAVDFDASIAPFYQVIVPLLENYVGSGEYLNLLSFDPAGMSELIEDITGNAHGPYLRIRRFLYLNPKNNVHIGVNSIHSSQLRHIRTNAGLLVSFELCKNLDNRTAAFYYRFEGPKSEVIKLTAAIQPVLETISYEAVSL